MKFIHAADLHLGTSFLSSSFSKDIAKTRKQELFEALERLIAISKKKEIDLLLLAGDLFEEETIKASDMKLIIDLFESVPDINIIISPGNHDYFHEKSYYNIMQFPKNVYIFKDEEIKPIFFENINTCVYGMAFNKKQYDNDIIHIPNLDKNKTNILLMHCDALTTSNYLPIHKDKLINSEFDYIALGHIHKPTKVSDKIYYPGSLEPLSFKETSLHGYIFGEIKNENKDLESKLIRGNLRQFINIDIDITGKTSLNDIVTFMKESVTGNIFVDLYRININGILDRFIDFKDIENAILDRVFYAEVTNNTTLDYDFDALKRENENNLIGKFIDALDTEEDKKAIYFGLNALMKGGNKNEN